MQRFTTFFSTINLSTTNKIIIFVVLTVIWQVNLRIFYRIKNQAAFITVGMLGMFVLMMIFVRPWATQPLARIVAALAGFWEGSPASLLPSLNTEYCSLEPETAPLLCRLTLSARVLSR